MRSGKITGDTKVWRDGLADWMRYGDILAAGTPVSGALAGSHRCAECGKVFPDTEMIAFENAWVCAACKPVFVQKLKEGIAPAGHFQYAGFWIRAAAKIIDGIILGAVNIAIRLAFQISLIGVGPRGRIFGPAYFVNLAIGIAFEVYFNGAFGATPGKMALKLKIVRANGDPITYMRALGRYFAAVLSGVFFGIGYMMAGWDSEKKALHDIICDTRVIKR